MNLKQKLCDPFGGLKTETADQLEQVADEYAIGFAEWCDKTTTQLAKGEWSNWFDNAENSLSSKEILEIYKKEKQL